ncbi:MAG TPA: hypothetical protein DDY78_01795 [Planctomycetales bacterium]|jgi:hypothetical protein|nr:hypothetical protein [Planctomycetales bacterium]
MKATKATIQARVEAVLRLRLDGVPFREVVRYGSEKGWAVSERQLQKYIRASDRLIARRFEKDRQKRIDRHVSMLRNLYRQAMKLADYRTALAVLDSEAKLLDLFPRADADALPRCAEMEKKLDHAIGTCGRCAEKV